MAQVRPADRFRLERAGVARVVDGDQIDGERLDRAAFHAVEIFSAQSGQCQYLVQRINTEHVMHSDGGFLRRHVVGALIIALDPKRNDACVRICTHRIAEQRLARAESAFLQSLLINRLKRHGHRRFGTDRDAVGRKRSRCTASAFIVLACIIRRAHRDTQRFKNRAVMRVEIIRASRSQNHLATVQREISVVRARFPGRRIVTHRQADRAAIMVSAHRVGVQRLASGEITLDERGRGNRGERHRRGRLRADGHTV